MEEEQVDMKPVIRLVKRVTRAFFQTPYIVVMDELTKHDAINDEELARTIGLNIKEIHKVCGALKEARMLKTFTRMEPKKADQRPVPKTYYYIDWQQFVNVVKWKIYKIRVMVSEKMRNEQENKGYICPRCHKTFSPLDVNNLVDHLKGIFVCDVCSAELKHNDNAENVKGSEQLHGRFMEQSQPIIELLKDIDKLRIPSTTVEKMAGASSSKGTLQTTQDKEIAYAQESGISADDIVVVFQDDNEATKKAKEAEIEKKRQQNALPAWHVRSTVSGETMVAEPSRHTASGQEKEENHDIEVEHSNEKNDERENFYAQYYASYQQQTESSTPSSYNNNQNDEDEEFEAVDVVENGINGSQDEYILGVDDDEYIVDGDGDEEFEAVNVQVNGHPTDYDDEFDPVDLEDDSRESKRSRTGSAEE